MVFDFPLMEVTNQFLAVHLQEVHQSHDVICKSANLRKPAVSSSLNIDDRLLKSIPQCALLEPRILMPSCLSTFGEVNPESGRIPYFQHFVILCLFLFLNIPLVGLLILSEHCT